MPRQMSAHRLTPILALLALVALPGSARAQAQDPNALCGCVTRWYETLPNGLLLDTEAAADTARAGWKVRVTTPWTYDPSRQACVGVYEYWRPIPGQEPERGGSLAEVVPLDNAASRCRGAASTVSTSGQADAWSGVPAFDDVRNQILGRDAFAVLGGAEWRVFDNAGRLRGIPGFLADRLQRGFTVLNDRVWLQAALGSLRTDMSLDEVMTWLGSGAPEVEKQFVSFEGTCSIRSGRWPLNDSGVAIVRIAQGGGGIGSCTVRDHLPNSSLSVPIGPPDPNNSTDAKSSEHSTVRGTINGSGDFIRFEPSGPRREPVPLERPRIVGIAWQRVAQVSAERELRIELPAANVVAEGGPARVVVDLAPSGAAAVLVVSGQARVRETTTGQSRTVSRGDAALVWPGKGVSQPVRVSADRFAAAARPRIRGSIVLQPGQQWSGPLRLDGGLLPIEARLLYEKPAGANYVLQIAVNGRPITDPLLNKMSPMRYADGRNYPYREPNTARWMLFYSHDYAANNGPAGGGYEVKTDPGQAYRYVWNVAPMLDANPVAQVQFTNSSNPPVPIELRLLPSEPLNRYTTATPPAQPPPPAAASGEPKKQGGWLTGLADTLKEVAKGVAKPSTTAGGTTPVGATGADPYAVTPQSTTAAGPVIREREPNSDDATAMLVQPGTTVDAALTAGSIQGRATDIDRYRVPVASPGLYTITVTPVLPDCGYSTGLPNLRGARGPSTMTVELTGQRQTHYTLRFGGQPEERSTTLGEEPRELLVVVDTEAWNASSDRGVQCVQGGAWHKEVPYRLTITAGGAALTAVTPPSTTTAGPVIREREPNSDAATAMLVQSGTTVDAALTAGSIQGRATDIDFYRVPVASPGLYTITVTPTLSDCNYSTGLTNLRGARGPSTMTVELTGQRQTHYTLRFGGQPEERSTTLGEEPRELLVVVDTEAWNASSDRGVQCVQGGAWHKEVPYRLTIAAGPTTAATLGTAGYTAPPPAPPPIPLPTAPPSAPAGGGVVRGRDFGEPAGSSGRISNIVTARDVRNGAAVDITDTFGPDVNPIHVWFRLSGFAPGTQLTSRWTYLGGSAPLVIGTGEFTIAPTNDYGTFSYELAAGKRWPAGEYRIEILLGSTVLGSAIFVVRPAQAVMALPPPPQSHPSTPAPPSSKTGRVIPDTPCVCNSL